MGFNDAPTTPEPGSERLEKFKGLLSQIQRMADQDIRDGALQVDSVRLAKQAFRNAIVQMSRVAQEVCQMIDRSPNTPGANPFLVNGGPEEITLGRLAEIDQDQEFNEAFENKDPQVFTDFLAKLIGSMRNINANFETADHDGSIAAAIRNGKD